MLRAGSALSWLLVLALVVRTAGHASLFVGGIANACTQQPDHNYASHGNPQLDPDTSIVLTDSNNQSVSTGTALCPGGTYHLNITWGRPRREFLVTSTYGTFTAANSALDPANCANRFYTNDDQQLAAAVSDLVLPCMDAMQDGDLQISITSVISSTDYYRQASASYPLDSSCMAGACAPPSPPPPAPPPSNPSVSPPPAQSTPPAAPAPAPKPVQHTCVTLWPEARLPELCQLSNSSGVSQAPACTIYRQCTGAGDKPAAQLCNVTRIFASLCMEFASTIPECAIAQALAGGGHASCLGASTFSLPSTSTVIDEVVQMCSDMTGMDGCSDCPSADSCPDPLSSLGKACQYMPMSQCGDWDVFCNSDGAVNGNTGTAAPGICVPEGSGAAQPAPAPPSSPCISSPKDASCSSYTLPDAESTAAVEALCGSSDSSQLPACSIWSACSAGNLTGFICKPFGVMATLCDAAPDAMACQTYQSLCKTEGSVVDQCTSVEPALTSLLNETSIASSLSASCWALSGPSSPVNCHSCTASLTCTDPFSALSMVCGGGANGSACADWQAWCSTAATAAPWYCSPQVYTQRAAAVSDILAATTSPPPAARPPSASPPPSAHPPANATPPSDAASQPPSQLPPLQPPPSGSYCIASWPEARLSELCSLSGASNSVTQSSACTIYRQCTEASYPPQAQLCNVTRIWGNLCLQAPDAIPECAMAKAAAGGDLTSCFGSDKFHLPSTPAIINDVTSMCNEMPMTECSSCTSPTSCADPLGTYSVLCQGMQTMSQCNDWNTFCGSDGAVDSNVGAAAPSLCIADALRADNAAQFAPPPSAPSSPCITGPQAASCASYSLPDSDSIAAVQDLCGDVSAQLSACSVWLACRASNLTGSVCRPFNIMATLCNSAPGAMACQTYQGLCNTSGSVVQQCTQVPAALTGLVSESSVATSLASSCWASPGPSSQVNCYSCTSNSTCNDPLAALSMVCGGGASGSTCSDWQAWCRTAAAAAPWYCSAQVYAQRAAAISAVLGLPVPPMTVSNSPPSSPPTSASPPPLSTPPSSTSSPARSPASPTASPSSTTSNNCVRNPTLSTCADYQYSDASATQDITTLCKSMPTMTGCSIWAACKANAGASGIFCSPFTLLATMCADMPTMTACASYQSLCNATGSVVRQCTSQMGIPDALSTTGTLNTVVSICSEMSMTDCSQCVSPFTTAACPDPLFTASSLCIAMPTMSQCGPYFDMCSGAATLAQGSAASAFNSNSLSRYCDSSAFTPGGTANSTLLLSRTYLPAMLNYFHQRTEEVVLWTEWIPRNGGQYCGAIIAIIALGFMSVLLKTVRSGLTLMWAYEESARAAASGARGTLRSKQDTLSMGAGEPGHVSLRALTDMEMHVAGNWWWLCTGRQMWQNSIKSALFGLSIGLDYLNMLVVMTFNIGFFVAVVGGYWLGSLLCTPVLENYSARLQQRKGQRSLLPTFHATLYAADAAAAAAAVAAKDVQIEVQPDSSAGSPESINPEKPEYVMVQQDDGAGECCCSTETENPVCCP